MLANASRLVVVVVVAVAVSVDVAALRLGNQQKGVVQLVVDLLAVLDR